MVTSGEGGGRRGRPERSLLPKKKEFAKLVRMPVASLHKKGESRLRQLAREIQGGDKGFLGRQLASVNLEDAMDSANLQSRVAKKREVDKLPLGTRIKFREFIRAQNLYSLVDLVYSGALTGELLRHLEVFSGEYILHHKERRNDGGFKVGLMGGVINALGKTAASPEELMPVAKLVEEDRGLRGVYSEMKNVGGSVTFSDIPMSTVVLAKYPYSFKELLEPLIKRGDEFEVPETVLGLPPIKDKRFSAKLLELTKHRVGKAYGAESVSSLVYVLGRQRYEPARFFLETLLTSPDREVRAQAHVALDRMSGGLEKRVIERIKGLREVRPDLVKLADVLEDEAPGIIKRVKQAEHRIIPWDAELGSSSYDILQSLYELLDPSEYKGDHNIDLFISDRLTQILYHLHILPRLPPPSKKKEEDIEI
jgi:hypothetical protein